MEFPYYVVNESWELIAGFIVVLDADELVRRYPHLRLATAKEVYEHTRTNA